jgi:hypothetical protein
VFEGHQDLSVPAILDSIPPGPFTQPPVDGDSSVKRADAYLGNEFRLHRDLHAILGFGFRRETGVGDNLIANIFPTHFSLTRSTPFATGE